MTDLEGCYGVVSAMQKWLKLREQYVRTQDYAPEVSMENLTIELYKSRLFARLLEGKEVYVYPPPLRYAGPWYELIEDGEAQLREEEVDIAGPKAAICNDNQWRVTAASGGVFTLRYQRDPESLWQLAKRSYGWKLTRA